MAERVFTSVCVRTDVTSVKCYSDVIIAGVGSFLCVYEAKSRNRLSQIDLLCGQRIHGIVPDPGGTIAVFGRNQICLFRLEDDWSRLSDLRRCETDDWVLNLKWLSSSEKFVIVTAHNVAVLYDSETCRPINSVPCNVNCILYCASITGDCWEEVAILAGTVFQEIVIWKICPPSHQVTHRLTGHDGVLFSITYDAVKRCLYSTSDDRTVRVWRVEMRAGYSWDSATVNLQQTLYGHSARVWRCISASDVLISIGEDSNVCIWNDSSGELIKRWQCHGGGQVWSVDCDPDKEYFVTGGSDGALRIWPFSAWEDECLSSFKINVCTSFSPRRLVLTAPGHLVVSTADGSLLHYDLLNGNEGVLTFHDDRFSNYCLLEASPCKNFVAIASIAGHICVFSEAECMNKNHMKKVLDLRAIDGRIHSLQWVSSEDILICNSDGNLHLWRLSQGDSSASLVKELRLPQSKERWPCAALRHGDFLVCGDRGGSIFVFDLTLDGHDPVCSWKGLHGKMGVSSIFTHNSVVCSLGRDGMFRRFQCSREMGAEQIGAVRLPFENGGKALSTSHGLLIAGFCSVHLVVYNELERRTLFKVDCGGGHRSWDCQTKDSGQKILLSFIKDKEVHVALYRLDLIPGPSLQTGFHPKETNCLKTLYRRDNFSLLISASEDTSLALTWLPCSGDPIILSVLQGHISSVRALSVFHCAGRFLLFSAGGRAQGKVWDVRVRENGEKSVPVVTHQELDSVILRKNSLTVDGDMRVMDLNVINWNKGSGVCCLAACSDGYLRLLNYAEETKKLSIANKFSYGRACIFKVSHWITSTQTFALTAASDGKLAFWDLGTCHNEPTFSIQLHQSGINSLDTMTIGTDTQIVATGGDDGAVSLCAFTVLGKLPQVLYRWHQVDAHTSQISGLVLMRDHLITASVDQHILVWKLDISLFDVNVQKVNHYQTSVSDVKGLEVCGTVDVCVYGNGMEVLKLAI